MTRTMYGLGLAFLLVLAGIGCSAVQKGQVVCEYETGTAPTMTETAWRGTYVLYSSKELAALHTVVLDRGIAIGFRKDDKGNLVAVAGDASFGVTPTTSHTWKRK